MSGEITLFQFQPMYDDGGVSPPPPPPPPPFTCDQILLEVWQPPAQAYNLRIRAYAQSTEFGQNDSDVTKVDSRLVFLMALANAKAHYRQPDAQQVAGQLQLRLRQLRARMHNDTRYTVGPKWRPPPMPIILDPDNT